MNGEEAMFGDDETDDNSSNGYSAANQELDRQLQESQAEIESKRQALSQQKLSIIKSQGGQQWEPGQMAAPIATASQKSANQFALWDNAINQMHMNYGTKLQYKIMMRNRANAPIGKDIL